MTETGDAPAPTRIVFGTDGWRARIAEDFTFENVRRCADGVATLRRRPRRAGEGRRHRLRPAVRLGALRAGRGRGPPRPRHPGRVQPDRGPDPDELVRGRPARRGGGHRDHRLAQPVDRQRVQGQVADRAPRRARDMLPAIEAAIAAHTRARRSSAGRSRTPRPPASSSGSTRSRATSGSSAGRSTSRRCEAADVSVLVEPLYGAGLRLDPAAARRRPDPGHRDPRRAQPVLRRRQPRADPAATSTRRWR